MALDLAQPVNLMDLRDLFDHVHDLVVVLDATGRLLFANRSWCEALGYDPAELSGLPFRDLVPPDELARWRAWLELVRPTSEWEPVRLTWRTETGREIPVEGSFRAFSSPGSAIRLIGIFHDVTGLVKAKQALRESEDVFHLVETNAPIGIFRTNAQGHLLRTNARWRQIASMTHTPQPHGLWWQMVDETDRPRVLAEWQGALKHGHEFHSEFRVNAGNDSVRYARTRIVRTHGSDGAIRAFVGVSEDITEQRRAEADLRNAHNDLERRVRMRTAQLEAANRELAQFAHVVAHDLKAPLRAVSNLADWLGRDYLNRLEPNGLRLLTLLQQRVRHMHDLIEGVLDYTRLGQVEEADVDVDVHSLVNDVLASLSPPAGITVRLPLLLPCVRGVPDRLRHVFQNLIDNAVKFMDKPLGVVTLTATRLPDAWEFAVSDNGPGIAPRYHAQVFAMFEQLPGQRKPGGTGIGLALVKRIVESRGGRVRLDSEEGAGATFTFTWPDKPRIEDGTSPPMDPTI